MKSPESFSSNVFPSTLYGVVAGQHGGLRATRSSAKAYAENYDPSGKISSKFDTKAEAEAGVAFNIDDPDSSDTASVGADSSGSDTETEVNDLSLLLISGSNAMPSRSRLN
jgi:hypothetical protein